MYLLTLILGIVLLREASTLKCYECIPGVAGTCTDTSIQCPSQSNQCAALRVTTYSGDSAISTNVKSCALSEDCGEYSVNFGVSRTVVTTKCCTSDLCNTQPAPEPDRFNRNGKKCFTCEGEKCTSTLDCQGNEDYCISATVNSNEEKITMKGCASRTLCLNTKSSPVPALFSAEFSCCQGDYCNSVRSPSVGDAGTSCSQGGDCNSASSTSAGLLLLVAPLISLVLC